MVTSLLLGCSPTTGPSLSRGSFPPPASVSAGEIDTLADQGTTHRAGADPAYLGTLAAARWAIGMISAAFTKRMAAQTPNG